MPQPIAVIRTNHVQSETPRHLHLMADYASAGVWDHDGAPLDPSNIHPNRHRDGVADHATIGLLSAAKRRCCGARREPANATIRRSGRLRKTFPASEILPQPFPCRSV